MAAIEIRPGSPEAGDNDMLSRAEQDKALGRIYVLGKKIKQDIHISLTAELGRKPTPEELSQEISILGLTDQIDKADDARAALWERNTGLVKKIASKNIGKGLDYEELFQEGNLGLASAIEHFDPEQGTFSSYAYSFIEGAITAARGNNRTIKVPRYIRSNYAHLLDEEDRFIVENDRKPTEAELLDLTGISTPSRQRIENALTSTSFSELDTRGDEDSDNGEIDFIDDLTIDPADEAVSHNLVDQVLNDPAISLSDLEKAALRTRFGVYGNPDLVFDEFENRYGIQAERVIQIANEALTKIRRNQYAEGTLTSEPREINDVWRDEVINRVNQYINEHYTSGEQVLYPEQMEVFEALAGFLAEGGTEGYFKLPTAFGKRILFTEFVKATGLRTLIVVPTMEVMDQTKESLDQLVPGSVVGEVSHRERDLSSQITVITYNSFLRLINGRIKGAESFDFSPEDIDLLILDEAHHALGRRTAEAVAKFSNAIKLGFTATPVYSQDRQLDKLLGTRIFGMSIKEAAEKGRLSPFRVWLALTDTDLSGVKVENNTGDYNQKELGKVINTASRNQGAVDLYTQYFGGDPAVVYCVSVKHAQDVARLFRERGIHAEAIWGNMDSSKRGEFVNAFKNGGIPVLCSVQVLSEGFDAPNASVCINLRPTLSAVVAEQRGGRVLRLDPKNPNKEATIIDFIDKEKSTRQQISFAEVAETAGIPPKLQNQIGALSHEPLVQTYAGLVGQSTPMERLKVITEVTEVLRIASGAQAERRQFRVIPEGFGAVPFKDLIDSYGMNYTTYGRCLRELYATNPEHFILQKGLTALITAEGLNLLRASIENLQLSGQINSEVTSQQYTPVEPKKLAESIGGNLSARQVKRWVSRIVHENQDKFRGGGKGHVHMASSEGMQIIITTLRDLATPDGYERVNLKALGKEYGIDPALLYFRVLAIWETNPEHVIRRGLAKPVDITHEGMTALREDLELRRGLNKIPYEELAEGYEGNFDAFRNNLKVFMQEHPEHFVRPNEGSNYYATEEGLELLRERRLPEGFQRFNLRDLVRKYSVSYTTLRPRIDALLEELPNDFIERGNARLYATQKGIDIVVGQLESNRIPEGFQPIRPAELAKRFGIGLNTVGRAIDRINSSHPAALMRRGGGRPIIATEEGLAMLDESLRKNK